MLAAVLGAGVLLGGAGCGTGAEARPDAVAPAAVAGSPAPAPAAAATVPEQRATPFAVRIPRLGVDSALEPLAVDAAGVLVPPGSPDVAGWHVAGTVPGEVGPAVIAGHVDSRSGPAVFYRLADLRPGDEVEVVRTDGVVRFRVLAVESVGKDSFPTQRVYGPTPVPELWLVTCGGEFDRNVGHYRSNVIVRAELVGDSTEPSG